MNQNKIVEASKQQATIKDPNIPGQTKPKSMPNGSKPNNKAIQIAGHNRDTHISIHIFLEGV